MPDSLVVVLLLIGPLGIWLLMRFLNKPPAEHQGNQPPTPPEA